MTNCPEQRADDFAMFCDAVRGYVIGQSAAR